MNDLMKLNPHEKEALSICTNLANKFNENVIEGLSLDLIKKLDPEMCVSIMSVMCSIISGHWIYKLHRIFHFEIESLTNNFHSRNELALKWSKFRNDNPNEYTELVKMSNFKDS